MTDRAASQGAQPASTSPPPSTPPPAGHPWPERRHWMSVLARAAADDLQALLTAYGHRPAHTILRGPEGGLVMVQGRAGGGGSAFNMGEMTVTRCSVRTGAGLVGHAYVAGRDARQAELAALIDAMMQDPDATGDIEHHIIAPLRLMQTMQRNDKANRAAATRVQFFAMQTMRS